MAIQRYTASGVVPAAGRIRIPFKPGNFLRNVVSQVSCNAPNVGSGATGNLYLNGDFIAIFVAQGDVMGGDPPVPVGKNELMYVEWASATVGARVEVTYIYDDGTG